MFKGGAKCLSVCRENSSKIMVQYILPSMGELREYLDAGGRSPYAKWFADLDSQAALRVQSALWRLEADNFSNVRGVGGGVFECKIHFGPGYRVYFGKEGDEIVILLAGGTKKRQQRDVRVALSYWQDYKNRRASHRSRQ